MEGLTIISEKESVIGSMLLLTSKSFLISFCLGRQKVDPILRYASQGWHAITVILLIFAGPLLIAVQDHKIVSISYRTHEVNSLPGYTFAILLTLPIGLECIWNGTNNKKSDPPNNDACLPSIYQ